VTINKFRTLNELKYNAKENSIMTSTIQPAT